MSITITTDVFCDGDDCQQWTNGETGPRVDTRGARRAAKARGWVRRNGLDLCPRCAGNPEPEDRPARIDIYSH